MEPLETNFRSVAFSVTGSVILFEIQVINTVMKKKHYHHKLGSMESCMERIMESMKGLYQRNVKGAINHFYF